MRCKKGVSKYLQPKCRISTHIMAMVAQDRFITPRHHPRVIITQLVTNKFIRENKNSLKICQNLTINYLVEFSGLSRQNLFLIETKQFVIDGQGKRCNFCVCASWISFECTLFCDCYWQHRRSHLIWNVWNGNSTNPPNPLITHTTPSPQQGAVSLMVTD